MATFDEPDFYGQRWASVYDERHAQRHAQLDLEAAVGFLAGLAGDGRVLELGIGTGRVAIPLTRRGVRVEGVDASQAMVDRLRAKPGGEGIAVAIGDMAEVRASGPYQLVYLVANTLFGLLTQRRQVDCFAAVARELEPGGAFVIECFVPDLSRFDRGQRLQTLGVSEASVSAEMSRHDQAAQRVTTQILTVDEGGTTLHPVAIRYAWPSELDLMAQLAGLRLRERHADWDRRAFDDASTKHVSVYEPS